MKLDLAILGVLILFGIFGMGSGASRQISHWAGLVLGYFAHGPLAVRLTPVVAAGLGWSPAGVKVALSGLLFYALYAAGTFAVHWPLMKLLGDPKTSRIERVGGFVLGAGKGIVMAFALLSVLLFFEKPLMAVIGKPPATFESSYAVGFVRGHNLFSAVPFPAIARMEKLLEEAKKDGSVQGAAADPKLRELLKNPALQAAMKTGDWSALRDDPRFGTLLKESKIAGLTEAK